MGMSGPLSGGNYDEVNDIVILSQPDELIPFLDITDGDFTAAEQFRFALESIFRWTLRRDELTDAEIVRAIKKVAMVALEDEL
jgi:hypothetical protein